MAQISFDFLHMDSIESNNDIPNGYDPDIVHQLEKFGYTKTSIITAINQIPNKNDINAILDYLESPRLKPNNISRSSSSSTADSISQCQSSLYECSSFVIINNLLEYYTNIASKTNTNLNDIFEYANFSNSDNNYYNFVSCFDHMIQHHLEDTISKLSFTQNLMENINGFKLKNTDPEDLNGLRKICIYLEQRKQELLPNETKNNYNKNIGNALKNMSKNALKNIGEMRQNIEVKQKLTKIVKNMKKSKHKNMNEMNVMNTEIQQQIIIHLQSVLMKYESIKDIETNGPHHIGANAFYITFDKYDQDKFDIFLMDSNSKCGRIIHRWLKYIQKYRANLKFDDLGDFIQKLSHTFCHFYLLQKKYSKCVIVLCYRCILRLKMVKDMVYTLLNMQIIDNVSIYHMEYHGTLKLDRIYQKKVMWMRVLDRKQLGIKDDFWLNNNVSVKIESKERRRVSKIGLFAGSDVPYAQSINLIGDLEIDRESVDKYKEFKAKRKHKSKQRRLSDRLLNINKKKTVVSVSFDYDDKDAEDKNNENEEDVLPFILPHFGLNTLLGAIKCIYKTAMKYYHLQHPHQNGDTYLITQDDLFPITLYCIIQSRLETPNKFIYFIEHILPKESVNYGQAAFALSGLKAAVSYILTAKPQTFSLNNEIELD